MAAGGEIAREYYYTAGHLLSAENSSTRVTKGSVAPDRALLVIHGTFSKPSKVYFTRAMPNPYAMALRERAVAAYERGDDTFSEIAATFVIDQRTLERWVARQRTRGSAAPFPKRGGWRSPIDVTVMRAVIAEAPDATAAELCWAYNRRVPHAGRTTETSLRRAMRRDGSVRKNNGRGRVRSTGPTSTRGVSRS